MVNSVLDDNLIELAYEAGFRSAFIGFESLSNKNLLSVNKKFNLKNTYHNAIKRLDQLGIMINASFIFGLDDDDENVFHNTTQWAIDSGITIATYHILTPYPGTGLYNQMKADNKLSSANWEEYDTRHLVFKHSRLSKQQMEEGYNNAYKEFYKLKNIVSASGAHERVRTRIKHLTYSVAWKKFEPVWNFVVKHELFGQARRILENTLK